MRPPPLAVPDSCTRWGRRSREPELFELSKKSAVAASEQHRDDALVPADLEVPPTRWRSWQARHKIGYRIAVLVVAAGAWVGAVWATLDDGIGHWWLIALGATLNVVTVWQTTRGLQMYVSQYDARHGSHDEPSTDPSSH